LSPQSNPPRRLRKKAKRKSRESQKLPPKNNPRNASAEITIEISLPSSKLAETVYRSLLPETKQPSGFRSHVLLKHDVRTLELSIVADDIVALRAASNTFLRFVTVAMKTVNVVAPFYRDASDV
jgi:tRNA threonylcarbamoyladenosine modification (KEOPS) complex  Pcc1 subunit